jgi:glycosyltransferase involved in cell wall biosynthesis
MSHAVSTEPPLSVLLIHQAFVPPNEPGGTRHYELGRHWVEQGNQFSIVTGDCNYLTGKSSVKKKGLVEVQDLDGVRVLRAYTYPSLHKSYAWRIVAFFSFMATSILVSLRSGPVDLVMGTSPSLFQACSAWIVAFLRRRPFLLEIRDLWPEFAIDMGVLKNPVLIRLSRWLERFLYARASHILVNSPAYRDYLLKKGIPAAKISVIPNGVDPAMFNPDARGETTRAAWNLADKFVVTYAGALGQANDIATIIGAAEQLRDHANIHFLLAGDGKERAKLEQLAQAHKLTNVTFTGSRPKSEMTDLLGASDACVATLQNIDLFKTTYPNKIFDYMAAGRPTILGIDGVIRDVVEQAHGGIFVPPGDHSALANAVLELERDRPRAQQMGRNARDYVVRHFNRHDQAAQFVNLLDRLSSNGASHAPPARSASEGAKTPVAS